MQSDAVVNKLAFVDNDFAIINADHGPQLVVRTCCPAVFDIFRESDPVVDREHYLLSLEHAKIARMVKRQPLRDAILSDYDTSLLTPKDFPLFAVFKTLFSDSFPNGALGDLMKLDNLSWLIGSRVTLLGVGSGSAVEAA